MNEMILRRKLFDNTINTKFFFLFIISLLHHHSMVWSHQNHKIITLLNPLKWRGEKILKLLNWYLLACINKDDNNNNFAIFNWRMKNSHKNQEFRFFLTRTHHTKQTCWLVNSLNSLNSLKKEPKHETTFTT